MILELTDNEGDGSESLLMDTRIGFADGVSGENHLLPDVVE
jgi:hypothetical protein